MKKMLWFIAFIVIVFLAVASWMGKGAIYQTFTSTPEINTISHSNFQVIAHRGYSAIAPENTLIAFRKAMEIGSDMIELDVHLSKDDHVIVIHDATLDRTTQATGHVRDKTLAELKRLEAGSWFDEKFNNELIPTLEETIQLVNGNSKLLIEIKVGDNNEIYPKFVARILELITKYNAADWCILQAFDSRYLQEIHQANYDIPYYKLIVNTHAPLPTYIDTQLRWGSLDQSIPYKAIIPYYKTLVPGQVSEWQSQGYDVFTYTVNEEEQMKTIIGMGINGIITNYPDRAIKLRRAIQKHQKSGDSLGSTNTKL